MANKKSFYAWLNSLYKKKTPTYIDKNIFEYKIELPIINDGISIYKITAYENVFYIIFIYMYTYYI